MRPKYYESVLGYDMTNYVGVAEFMEEACDSMLECMFGVALAIKTGSVVESKDGYGKYLRIWEPFQSSPTGNGDTAGIVYPQYHHNGRVWDFAVLSGNDNSARVQDCELCLLVDIDGYGIHRQQRRKDEIKQRTAQASSVRLPEERFSNINEMAECVLWGSVWYCGCDWTESPKPDCRFCGDLRLRAIWNDPQSIEH